MIQTLDGRLAKLSQTLMKNFCYAFIRKPSTDFKRTEMFGVSRPVSQYVVKRVVDNNASKEEHYEAERVFEFV